jgi:polysaccharide biosynthesis protein VpsQ
MKLFTRFVLTLLPILYMSLIWIQSSYFDPESLSSLSSQISLEVILLLGIVLELSHLFEFGVLYFFIIFTFLSFGKLTYFKEIIAIMLAFSYGVVDEIHQWFIPYRSTSIVDLVKNTIGIFVFWWIMHRKYFKRPYSKVTRAMKKVTQISETGNGR